MPFQRIHSSEIKGSGNSQNGTPRSRRPLHDRDREENKTGLPDQLKAGIESLSGLSMDDVKVHYNSSEPSRLQAFAYTQGTDIHVGPGQERHLPHEAWHVVQQKQGRVRPTMRVREGVAINDDAGLEHEAGLMGERAVQMRVEPPPSGFDFFGKAGNSASTHENVVQGKRGKKGKKFKNKQKEFIGGKNSDSHVHLYQSGGGHLKVDGTTYSLTDPDELERGIGALEDKIKNMKVKNTNKDRQFKQTCNDMLEEAKKWRKDDEDDGDGGDQLGGGMGGEITVEG